MIYRVAHMHIIDGKEHHRSYIIKSTVDDTFLTTIDDFLATRYDTWQEAEELRCLVLDFVAKRDASCTYVEETYDGIEWVPRTINNAIDRLVVL